MTQIHDIYEEKNHIREYIHALAYLDVPDCTSIYATLSFINTCNNKKRNQSYILTNEVYLLLEKTKYTLSD